MRVIRWTAACLALVLLGAVIYCAAVAFEPYRQVAATLQAAPALAEYPKLVVNATITVEDPTFYENSRFESARRFYAALTAKDFKPVGATIASQLVRSVLVERRHGQLTNAFVTIAVESSSPKEQILSAYLAGMSFGSDVHGFKAAAPVYFNKSLEQLNVAEVAMLVGLIKGPSYYSPVKNPQRALERRNRVLESLMQSRIITEQQFHEASNVPLPKEA